MKESDLIEYRKRRFAQDFLQRIKRLDKATHHYKFPDMREDDGERKWVQCVQCLKNRPLLGGMDPRKFGQPFVCWMNFDEVHASCSAPESALIPRPEGEDDVVHAPNHSKPQSDDSHPRRSGGATSRESSNNRPSGGNGAEAPKKGSRSAQGGTNKKVKRKSSSNSTNDKAASSGANGKKPKRR